jgi:hypothetical protein
MSHPNVHHNRSNVIEAENVYQKQRFAMAKFNVQMLKMKKIVTLENLVDAPKTPIRVDRANACRNMSSVMR